MVVKELSLGKNISWTLIGSIIYSFTQWLLLIVIAKLATPEMVGQYALGLAITAPIMMLTDMKLRLALVTDAKASFDFKDYLGTRIVTVGFFLMITAFVVLLLGYDSYTATIILLIGVAKMVESVSDIFHAQLQKNERMDIISISIILKGTVSIITFSILLYVSSSLILALVGQVFVWLCIFLFYDCMVTKKFTSINASFHAIKMKSLLKLTLPLGFMALLNSFNTNVPSYMVEYLLDKEALGYFAALLYILFAGNRFINALRQPIAKRLAKKYEEQDIKGFRKLMMTFLVIGVSLSIAGILAAYVLGDFLLSVIYTPEYQAYSDLFVVIMLTGIFSYPAMLLDTGIMATRSFKIQPYLAFLWVIISLIGCYVLIPLYGLYGAAYALIISSFSKFMSLFIVLIYKLTKTKGGINLKFSEVKAHAKKDEASTYYMQLQRRLGLVITWLLLKALPSISANVVTLCMLPLNILAAALLYMAITSSSFLLLFLSFFISFLTFTLDCADGNIARIKQTASIKGVYFDRLVHNISHPLFFLVLGFALYERSNQILLLIIFIVVAILSELSPLDVSQKDVEALFIRQAVYKTTVNYNFQTHNTGGTSSSQQSKQSKITKIVKTVLSNDTYYLLILIDILLFEHHFYVTGFFAMVDILANVYAKSSIHKWENNLNEVLEKMKSSN